MHRQYHKRQTQSSLLAVPSADGLDGNGITADSHSTGTELAYNTLTSQSGSYSAPPLQFGGSGLTITTTTPLIGSTSSSSSPDSSVNSNANSKSSSSIPVSTVIGICVGTFVAAGLLICLSVMIYRRSSRRPSRARSASRSAGIGHRSEAWKKLGDDQDHWEGKAQIKEVERSGLQKSPSALAKTPALRVAPDFPDTNNHSHYVTPSFSAYHPKLAEELAQPPRAFVGHKEGIGSWDGSTVVSGREDFSSLQSVHIESGAMSPSLSAAKMTPPSTASGVHRWESAEVVLPQVPPINPFVDTPQAPVSRTGASNPFFGAQGARRPTIGRKMIQPQDPFSDQHTVEPIPRISHMQSNSITSDTSSAYVTDRAMQSLITALNLPQEEVEKRLRIASMQPSEMSMYSVLTNESLYGPESKMFPNPPAAH